MKSVFEKENFSCGYIRVKRKKEFSRKKIFKSEAQKKIRIEVVKFKWKRLTEKPATIGTAKTIAAQSERKPKQQSCLSESVEFPSCYSIVTLFAFQLRSMIFWYIRAMRKQFYDSRRAHYVTIHKVISGFDEVIKIIKSLCMKQLQTPTLDPGISMKPHKLVLWCSNVLMQIGGMWFTLWRNLRLSFFKTH